MAEILAGAAIAISWIALFMVTWVVSKADRETKTLQKSVQEQHLRLVLASDKIDRHYKELYERERALTANVGELHKVLDGGTGVWELNIDPETKARSYKRSQLLEDEFLAQQDGRGPMDVMEAAGKLMASGRT